MEDDKEIESLVLVRLMKLNATITGINLGLIFGLTIFLATNILLIKGGDVIGPHLALLGQYFIGYKVTFVGSMIGLLYGFGLGFIIGYAFARLYNWLADLRENRRNGQPQG
ncbi:MAG: hypothetical protein QXQ53_02840 [Candidatus Methanosuratincola sp.]